MQRYVSNLEDIFSYILARSGFGWQWDKPSNYSHPDICAWVNGCCLRSLWTKKREFYIYVYIYIFSVVRVWCQLIFVSQCAMTCCTVLVKQRYVQRYFLLTLSTTMTLSLSKVVIVWSLKETTTEPFYWNVSHILCMLWESIIKRLSADYERCNKQRKTKHYKNNTFNVSQRRLHRQCHTVGTESRVNNTFHIWGPYSVL